MAIWRSSNRCGHSFCLSLNHARNRARSGLYVDLSQGRQIATEGLEKMEKETEGASKIRIRLSNFLLAAVCLLLMACSGKVSLGPGAKLPGGGQPSFNDASTQPDETLAPAPVWSHITAGADHNCAVDAAGHAQCWGSNLLGQMGTSLVGSHLNFVSQTTAVPAIREFAPGGAHTCAVLRDNGALRCWGDGRVGQLGYGNRTSYLDITESPDIDLPEPIHRVIAGDHHTCAIAGPHRGLRCWGTNDHHELGYEGSDSWIGTTPDQTPGKLADLPLGGPVRLAAASQWRTCAVADRSPDDATQTTWCWGKGFDGPTAIPLTKPVKQLVAGFGFSCALSPEGEISCWGVGYGVAGDAHGSTAIVTVDVGGRSSFLAAGHSHVCAALQATGQIRCWGDGNAGKLGYGGTEAVSHEHVAAQPAVDIGEGVVEMALGSMHSCALRKSGAVRCWGLGEDGRLGHGYAFSIADVGGETPAKAWDLLLNWRQRPAVGAPPALGGAHCGQAPPPSRDLHALSNNQTVFAFVNQPLRSGDPAPHGGGGPGGAGIYVRVVDLTDGERVLGFDKIGAKSGGFSFGGTFVTGHTLGIEVVEYFGAAAEEPNCSHAQHISAELSDHIGLHPVHADNGKFYWETAVVLGSRADCPPAATAQPPAVQRSEANYAALFAATDLKPFHLNETHAGDARLSGTAPKGFVIAIFDSSVVGDPALATVYVGGDGKFDVPVCPALIARTSQLVVVPVDIPVAPTSYMTGSWGRVMDDLRCWGNSAATTQAGRCVNKLLLDPITTNPYFPYLGVAEKSVMPYRDLRPAVLAPVHADALWYGAWPTNPSEAQLGVLSDGELSLFAAGSWKPPVELATVQELSKVTANSPFSGGNESPVDAIWYDHHPNVNKLYFLRGTTRYTLRINPQDRTAVWQAPIEQLNTDWRDAGGPFAATNAPVDAVWHRYEAGTINKLVLLRASTRYAFDFAANGGRGAWETPTDLAKANWASSDAPFANGDSRPIDAAWHVFVPNQTNQLVALRGDTQYVYNITDARWSTPTKLVYPF